MRRLWAPPPIPLGVEIALAIFLTVGVMSAVALWRVHGAVHAQRQQTFEAELRRGVMETDADIAGARSLDLLAATGLSTRAEFVDGLASRNLSALVQRAAALNTIVGPPFTTRPGLNVYDADGLLLFRTASPQSGGQEPPDPIGQRALAGTPTSGLLNDPLLGLSTAGAARLVTTDGRTVGVVEVLSSMDAQFAKTQSDLVGLHVAVMSSNGTVNSSNPGWHVAPNIDTSEAQHRPTYLPSDNQQFLAMVLPLSDGVSGSSVGSLYLGIERSEIDAAVTDARINVLWAIGVALVVGAASPLASAF